MTRSVADAALLMNVLTEPDTRDGTLPPDATDYLARLDGGVKGLRIAFTTDLGYVACVDPAIAAALERVATELVALGAEVERVDPGFADPAEPFAQLFFGGAANALRLLGPEQRAKMDPELVAVADAASRMHVLDYLAAQNARAALLEQMAAFHRRYDLLLTPTLPIAAFEAGREVPAGWPQRRWPSWTPFTFPFNMTGQPAVSVPCGFTGDGLPIGLQLVGARHADALVLRAAHSYEQAHPVTRRPPLLDAEPQERAHG
jgi:aspartyl-tRNA(Asn)/glutamyl-tRNA(Gln) amidotransferase subunit A